MARTLNIFDCLSIIIFYEEARNIRKLLSLHNNQVFWIFVCYKKNCLSNWACWVWRCCRHRPSGLLFPVTAAHGSEAARIPPPFLHFLYKTWRVPGMQTPIFLSRGRFHSNIVMENYFMVFRACTLTADLSYLYFLPLQLGFKNEDLHT